MQALILLLPLVMLATSASAGDLETNKDLARRMIAAINARDFDALDQVVAPDVRRHSTATPGVEVRSLDDFKAFLRQDLVAVPDAHQDIRAIVAEGDTVAVRVVYRGTQTGPMGPFPPSGRTLVLPVMGFLRVADGKIAEMWVEWDNLAALTQLGHMPASGSGVEARPPAPPGAEDANMALARRWFDEVINRRNLDAIADTYAPGYVYHGQGGLELHGPAAARTVAASIFAASEDRHAVVEQQLACGDFVVTRFTSRGMLTGPWHGVEPSGQLWVTEGIDISRIEGGKVTENWEVITSSGL
jgi:steroid delta-isomerase-like uncharacterized protein